MVINAELKPSASPRDVKEVWGTIAVFHCANAVGDVAGIESYEIKNISLPCSSMNRDFILLKAFEAGADAVVVLACPEGSCRYVDGNLRAQKRVGRVKKILDDIGLDGRRLNFYHVSPGDGAAVERIIARTALDLDTLGPNPAR